MFQTGKDVWDFVPNLPTDFQCRSLLSLPQFAALKREAKGREKRVLFLFFFFKAFFKVFLFDNDFSWGGNFSEIQHFLLGLMIHFSLPSITLLLLWSTSVSYRLAIPLLPTLDLQHQHIMFPCASNKNLF